MKYDHKLLESGINHGSNPNNDKNVHKSKPIDWNDICRVNRRFMGAGISQSYVGIYFFEYYYETHRFEYVVEFGSQKGSLSTYFANMAGITEQFFFDTFELYPDQDWYCRPNEGAGHWFDKLETICPYVHSYHQDIFSDETKDHVQSNVSQFKTFVFCDGGDKIQEFKTYAPMLKSGDCIAVHDWPMEINESHISDTCDKYGLILDYPWSNHNSQFGTFIMPFRKK